MQNGDATHAPTPLAPATPPEKQLPEKGGAWAVSMPVPPVSVKSENKADKEPITVPLLGVQWPAPINSAYYYLTDKAQRARRYLLEQTPAPMVNNSSNVIGALHVGGDIMMLKANGTEMLRGAVNPAAIDYIWLPFKNTMSNAKFTFSIAEMGTHKFWTDSLHNLTNFSHASHRDGLGTAGKLFNRWQARSTLCGLSGMAIAAVMPDDEDNRDNVENMTRLLHEQPLFYFGKRLYQAVNPLEWPSHKRQFAGMAITAAGACSFLSGFRNVSKLTEADQVIHGLKELYRMNVGHSLGGLVTFLGGTELWLGVDDEEGWKDFGKVMTLRIPLLYPSIKNRFKNPSGVDDGRWWYVGGQGTFTSKDILAYCIGGAEKDADGNVIDKKAIRDEAERHAEEGELQRLQEQYERKHTKPQTVLDPSPRDVQPMQQKQVSPAP